MERKVKWICFSEKEEGAWESEAGRVQLQDTCAWVEEDVSGALCVYN